VVAIEFDVTTNANLRANLLRSNRHSCVEHRHYCCNRFGVSWNASRGVKFLDLETRPRQFNRERRETSPAILRFGLLFEGFLSFRFRIRYSNIRLFLSGSDCNPFGCARTSVQHSTNSLDFEEIRTDWLTAGCNVGGVFQRNPPQISRTAHIFGVLLLAHFVHRRRLHLDSVGSEQFSFRDRLCANS